jgi:predicted dehydrogenase
MNTILVGIGGYGHYYLDYLLGEENTQFELVGAVDPLPERSGKVEALSEHGVPVFASLDACLAGAASELVIVASPIQFHAEHMCTALAHGCHVLCEKPLCGSRGDIARMRSAEQESGRHVAIGYQWSFSDAIQALKADLLEGVLGAPRRFRTMTLWPRSHAYYARNSWAGKVQDAEGRWVLDSPVNNATAHYLHNMLYLLGPDVERSATPAQVNARLYRANEIENFDTAVMRVETTDGVEVLFYSTHASRTQRGPEFILECEHATVTLTWHEDIIATFAAGAAKSYGNPDHGRYRKLMCTAEAIAAGRPSICGIAAAANHTECVVRLHDDCEIEPFDARRIHVDERDGTQWTWVEGLDEEMVAAYEEGRSEISGQ